MAYDKLVEDLRIFDAADGNDVVPEDHNEFEDQVKGMVKALSAMFWNGTPCNDPGTIPNFNDWDLRGPGTGGVIADTGFWFWEASGNGVKIAFPLTGLRAGQKITEVTVVVGGSTIATGGAITLYYGAPASAMTAVDIDDVANVFECGVGEDESDPITYTETLTLTVVAGYQYFIVVESSAANGGSNRIYDVSADAQFGS